jgi:arylsulfatase A-like enzyme
LKLLVTVGLFTLLFWPERFGLRPDQFGGIKPWDLWREISQSSARDIFLWLSLGALIKLAGMLCGVLRWRLLLRGQGLRMPFWYMVGSWFVGRTFGIFLPGTIGLDGYRLYDSARYTGEVIKCTTVIAVEKLIGFIALTGLVFLTFPLGFRIIHVKIAVLAVILAVLGGLVITFFLLLLNPRVIQVLAAVMPTPRMLRNKIDKLGAAATAYSGHRAELVLAVVFGFLVHLATCFTYFCTMMAIRAGKTDLLDILFASPLVIYATVIGPSIGGEGIREIVSVALLGQKGGAAVVATFSHLAWWVGDVVPFLVGLPIYVFRSRPGKAQLQAELAEARRAAAEQAPVDYLHLPADAVASYRRGVYATLAAGLFGGFLAGALIGLGESVWIFKTLSGLTEFGMFPWGALIYGKIFAVAGLGIAAGLLFLYLLVDRFAAWFVTFAASFAGALSAGALVIGLWRFQRDVLTGHAFTRVYLIQGLCFAIGGGLIALGLAWILASGWNRLMRSRPVSILLSGCIVCLLPVLCGVAAAKMLPVPPAPSFQAQKASTGPNIILIACDAMRADYLPMYSPMAIAKTPAIDAFAKDAVLFENAFSQAPWTKPAFGSIFTGVCPSSHGATNKEVGLAPGVETFAGLLRKGGYYTKGFANNPNIASEFGFNQGFVDYTDLRPQRYFYAGTSASKLSMYEVLRKGRQRVFQKLGRFIPWFGRMDVHDFYQPAETVTHEALSWLDKKTVSQGAPFYLFLHYMDTHDPFMDHHHPGVGYARSILGDHPDPLLQAVMRNAYNSDIEYIDSQLALLFDGLKQRGCYDDTLIVFTADHGEEFLEHNGWWHGFTLYDEMLHIPLIIKLPGAKNAGTHTANLASHIDLAPTLLQFGGEPRGAKMAGQFLFDKNGALSENAEAFTYAENDFEGNIVKAARTIGYKLIHANPDNVSGLAPIEFYDVKKDPHEKDNRNGAAECAAPQTTLEKVLADFQAGTMFTTPPPSPGKGMSKELEEQLKSLGYVR